MVDLTESIRNALDYIEANLARDLQLREIAKRAYLSPYYFQRVFAALCGVGVGEYIRCRRLTLAGEELAVGEGKVIDVAAKYGYDSPDSFARAFHRFHGMAPSAARKPGAVLRTFAPVDIRRNQKGICLMEYRIEEKPQFTVMGVSRKFSPETAYQKIPEYWTEMMSQPDFPLMGRYGICSDEHVDEGEFDYWIADDYIPWKPIPAGCKTMVIPATTWAVFPCTLSTLQDTNTRMWQQWLPGHPEYRLSGRYNLEVYGPFCQENPGQSPVELWLPVEKA
jgi:AraC family transcriptional regulator